MENTVDIRIHGEIIQTAAITTTIIIHLPDRWIEIGDKRGDMNLPTNLVLETIHLQIGIMLHINISSIIPLMILLDLITDHCNILHYTIMDHHYIIRCRE
jgi:hypothetical protein